jgi:hypothetical protein
MSGKRLFAFVLVLTAIVEASAQVPFMQARPALDVASYVGTWCQVL